MVREERTNHILVRCPCGSNVLVSVFMGLFYSFPAIIKTTLVSTVTITKKKKMSPPGGPPALLSPRVRVTNRRSGRRGRSPARSGISLSPSERLTTILQETGGDRVKILGRLLQTLEDNEVPGPQFFRLRQEFSAPLGEGGEGNVRGIDEAVAKRYDRADEKMRSKWPVRLIAIKQYQRTKDKRALLPPTSSLAAGDSKGPAAVKDRNDNELTSRFRAAECEVLALSPADFRGHPNIVQLVGWGLCLDTLENPGSSCCGPVQLPLLILERADMDFEQFLRSQIFPAAGCRGSGPAAVADSDLEARHEGQRRQRPNRGVLASLATHAPALLWKLLAQGTGLLQDAYETVRLLCIDIGHGLGCLHDHGFTHGDLKPENVLIFRTQKGGWQAKLCDFGCAIGKAAKNSDMNRSGSTNTSANEPFKIEYRGTPMFLPTKEELKFALAFEELLLCDLYVYGLVVWYAFSGGQTLPANANVQVAEAYRLDLAKQMTWGFPWWPVQEQRDLLDNKLKPLLEATMPAIPQLRNRCPWVFLYDKAEPSRHGGSSSGSGSGSGDGADDDAGGKKQRHLDRNNETAVYQDRAHRGRGGEEDDSSFSTNVAGSFPLEPSVKAKYNEQSWWEGGNAPVSLQDGNNSDEALIDASSEQRPSSAKACEEELYKHGPMVITTERSDKTDEESGGGGAVTSEALEKDDDSLKLTLFDTERRRGDVASLRREMHDILASWGAWAAGEREKLYFLARFRSRVPLAWWDEGGNMKSSNKNIVGFALQSVPPVEISTLAWLCKGPVGKREVENLDAGYPTWGAIVHGQGSHLNESERLDRFLLLLQFGARVNRILVWPPFDESSKPLPPCSILVAFIQSCRPATKELVAEKLYQRLVAAGQDGLVSKDMWDYFEVCAGDSDGPLAGTTVEVLRGGRSLGDTRPGKRWVPAFVGGICSRAPSKSSDQDYGEPEPFLGEGSGVGAMLQKGWAVFESSRKTRSWLRPFNFFASPRKTTCYEDEFTQTVTVIPPQVSLIERRQVRVGFLGKEARSYCHVDLLVCHGGKTRRGRRQRATRMELRADIEDRFPYYSDGWFLTEWRRELSQEDVLGDLIDVESWRLPSFAIRVPLPKIDFLEKAKYVLSGFLWVVTPVLWGIVILGLLVIILPGFIVLRMLGLVHDVEAPW